MKKRYISVIVVLLLFACKEAYNPPVTSPVTGYLVVEGFINSGNGVSTIKLTRSLKLVDTVNIIYEQGAQVNIEDENNSLYPLQEHDSGTYISGNVPLNPAVKYRVHITTTDGKEYVSDFTAVRQTPPIDSISWQKDNGGIRLYVNTHDPQGNTTYYRWKYAETWEFHSSYVSTLTYVKDPVNNSVLGITYRLPSHNIDTSVYRCWRTLNPSAILLGSSEKLSEDRIHLSIQYIEPASQKLSVLYSLELKQYGLSKPAYIFYQNLKKNTEQLGSIFDAQPSELGGNMHCINDPAAAVIGYIEVTQEQVQRIFIRSKDITDWNYDYGTNSRCASIEVVNQLDSILEFSNDYEPTYPLKLDGFGGILSFSAAPPLCVDCTLSGTNIRPPFWP